MKDAMNVLLTRRSIRSYKSDPVPEEIVEKIIEAGLYAPTGMGLQDPIIIAVTNKEMRDKIAKENAAVMGRDHDPFYGAPVILLVAAKVCPNAVYDGSCVMDNLLNAAWAMGLGSCWIHRAKEESCWIHRAKEELERPFGKELLSSLGIEGEYIGIGHVALGYIEGEPPAPKPRNEGRVFWVK